MPETSPMGRLRNVCSEMKREGPLTLHLRCSEARWRQQDRAGSRRLASGRSDRIEHHTMERPLV